jgi:protein-tyrosine phosphatase
LNVPLSNLNFRDLGDIPVGASQIRSGILYRSEGPANFTTEQLTELASLGIRNIVDLRSARERDEMPHNWYGASCEWRGLNVDADLRVFGNEGRERLMKGLDPQIAIDTMTETYREIPHALRPHWAAIADCFQDAASPVLVNCTAGKDRTGVAIALLLELAGVSRDAIMQDYLQSSIFGENLKQSGMLEAGFMGSYGFMPSPGQVDALIGVRPEYLHAAWGEIDRGWSGVPHYLAEAGMADVSQQQIRKFLVADDVQNKIQGAMK